MQEALALVWAGNSCNLCDWLACFRGMENLSFVNVFPCKVAASLSEALAAIRSHTFDVVLSDLNINAEGDEFTVIYTAHEANPGCVTILLTGRQEFINILPSAILRGDYSDSALYGIAEG